MALTVRPAQMKDVAALTELTSQLGYHSTQSELTQRLAMITASNKHMALVAHAEDVWLLGWVVIEHRVTLESGERAEITGLVVSDKARGQGVGKRLVQNAIEWAKAQSLNKVMVSSNITRDGSHHFYRQIGFIERKTSKQYIKQI
ncbi:GNAT family N-acetyltransferase [Pseudoalteromonas sp. SMS1]|uniref:GNAT family N-acetyltransferase n=1 Tax=Pseudoalteromonas sp. SMS1 TaxID=2908894 RepID=UPI001F2454BC|nr:GNAT family N-acetyltransferase [Pseudoalteromonas sp. SMS1]MCF2859485.1 GNAT family N-acetyltransferase [Pseudoalteromonas sp. SMS1]